MMEAKEDGNEEERVKVVGRKQGEDGVFIALTKIL
jgi:hypothetical protein